MIDADDVAIWTRPGTVRGLIHLLCCTPDTGSCAIWRETRPINSSSSSGTDAEWAAFQLACHNRGDLINGLHALWGWSPDISWWDRADRRFQSLPEPARGLWVLIGRGADDSQLLEFPRGWFPKSWAGTMRWRDAEKLLKRNKAVIREWIDDGVGQLVAALNPPANAPVRRHPEFRLTCEGDRHVWAVGGTPSMDQWALCRCGRFPWRDHVTGQDLSPAC